MIRLVGVSGVETPILMLSMCSSSGLNSGMMMINRDPQVAGERPACIRALAFIGYTLTYFQRKYLPPCAPLPGQPISSSQRLDQLDQFVKDRKLLESSVLQATQRKSPLFVSAGNFQNCRNCVQHYRQ